MNNYTLSIVIPTVKYTSNFDKTLLSCLNLDLNFEFEILVSVNNSSFKDFKSSKYFNDENIVWKCIEKETIPMPDSINKAIEFSSGEWIFILSDDDLILEGFLSEVNLLNLSEKSLYATRINIIDENDNFVRENLKYSKEVYSRQEALDLYFKFKIHNHISLLVFHRNLIDKKNIFRLMGYPNGYYIDTVFHGKALANCDYLYTAEKVVFSRRESSTQGSSKFYFNKELNDYFNTIVDAYFEDEIFKEEVLTRYDSREAFYKKMMQNRFYTEWSKLNKPVYNKSIKKKFEFLYKHTMYWNTGIGFKFYTLLYLMRFELVKNLPQSVKNQIKKLLGR